MSQNQYFRAGTGSVIYNEKGQVLLFSRSDRENVWQFQQGGMEVGEDTHTTLWRELVEETALIKENFSSITTHPTWLHYEYPDELRQSRLWDPNCVGQTHCWFYLQLNPDTQIDITKAVDKEFVDWKWSTFPELIAETDTLKLAVYKELENFFKAYILPTLEK